MRINSSSKLITSAVLMFSCFSIGATYYSYHMVEHRRYLSENVLQAVNAANDLLTGSDVDNGYPQLCRHW